MIATPAHPTGTVTFLFTDIEGSTRAWEENQSGLGPSGMARGLARHNAILDEAAAQNGGYVFKTMGDAYCIAFGTAQDALAAAIDAQFALMEEDWTALGVTRPVRVRMALHTGTAQAQGGDYYGPVLNRTARILATGHGGRCWCRGRRPSWCGTTCWGRWRSGTLGSTGSRTCRDRS